MPPGRSRLGAGVLCGVVGQRGKEVAKWRVREMGGWWGVLVEAGKWRVATRGAHTETSRGARVRGERKGCGGEVVTHRVDKAMVSPSPLYWRACMGMRAKSAICSPVSSAMRVTEADDALVDLLAAATAAGSA